MTTKPKYQPEHADVRKDSRQMFYLPITCMDMLARGDYAQLARACAGDGQDTREALLVFMVESRNEALVAACEQTGFVDKIKNGVGMKVQLYLWTQMHEDFMWLAGRSNEWKKILTNIMPWKVILAKSFHKPEWNASLAIVLEEWEPQRLDKYPYALKYMVNPSERHILAAACGQDNGYINAAQIDAIQPGASQWLKMRKTLGIEETREQARHAFLQWCARGPDENIDSVDAEMFSQSSSM